MGDLSQPGNVTNIASRIADAFAKDGAGLCVNQARNGGGAIVLGETRLNTLAGEHAGEQGIGGAIELWRTDNIAPVIGEGDKGKVQGGLARGSRQTRCSAFEGGHARFENSDGGIIDPSVAKTFSLKIKQGRTMVGAIEILGGGLIDRHGHGVGRRIMVKPAV